MLVSGSTFFCCSIICLSVALGSSKSWQYSIFPSNTSFRRMSFWTFSSKPAALPRSMVRACLYPTLTCCSSLFSFRNVSCSDLAFCNSFFNDSISFWMFLCLLHSCPSASTLRCCLWRNVHSTWHVLALAFIRKESPILWMPSSISRIVSLVMIHSNSLGRLKNSFEISSSFPTPPTAESSCSQGNNLSAGAVDTTGVVLPERFQGASFSSACFDIPSSLSKSRRTGVQSLGRPALLLQNPHCLYLPF
mmetsp:Transcript_10860/g.67035  ORF Transcript_10860/g.67035 Transcript_10860/m.67035 type:complete len:248 (+) Transcript_10860:3667-4410(+)